MSSFAEICEPEKFAWQVSHKKNLYTLCEQSMRLWKGIYYGSKSCFKQS